MSDDTPRRDVAKLRVTIARHLRDIETLALDLHAQALNDANARDFPGGTALHMLAPAASIADWETQYEATEERERWDDDGNDRWAKQPKLDPAIYQGDETEQPLNVLESWTRIVREERGQPTQLKATISREVDYLRGALDWMCAVDEWTEPSWPAVYELAEELRVLVRRMEDVLHMGIRSDRINAECYMCDEHPRLIVQYGSVKQADWWKCPHCRQDYDIDGVRKCWRKTLVRRGRPPKWMPLRRAASAVGRPVSTVRSWTLPRFGKPPKVKSKTDHGVTLVKWVDVRKADDATRRRKHGAA